MFLAALVAALVVPVGFALSLEFNSGDLEVHALCCRVTRRPALVVDA